MSKTFLMVHASHVLIGSRCRPEPLEQLKPDIKRTCFALEAVSPEPLDS